MTLFDVLEVQNYPLYITVSACVVLLMVMIVLSYRRTSPIIAAIFFVGSFVFLHLDLASYNISYPLMNKFLGIFRASELPIIIYYTVKIIGYGILILIPLSIWYVPLVMLDEQLCDHIKESDDIKIKKDIAIALVGVIVNVFFIIGIFKSKL